MTQSKRQLRRQRQSRTAIRASFFALCPKCGFDEEISVVVGYKRRGRHVITSPLIKAIIDARKSQCPRCTQAS